MYVVLSVLMMTKMAKKLTVSFKNKQKFKSLLKHREIDPPFKYSYQVQSVGRRAWMRTCM